MVKAYIQSKPFAYRRETQNNMEVGVGILDGVTLLRFAHMWRNASSGGVEAHLRNLNRHLLKRNRMRILQMYLVAESGPFDVEIQQVGQGELVWIPSIFKNNQRQQLGKTQRLWTKIRGLIRPEFRICHDILISTLANYQINLAVFHWISEDSRIVLDYLKKRRVPFAVVNHFQNTRLKRRYIRTQISGARAIGGVSGIGVPIFVRSRFTNLSNAVDTDFFHPEKAVPVDMEINYPLILLPSRITEQKGHIDAIRALGRLAQDGVSAVLTFAGRQGSRAFMEKMKRVIAKEGVQERVIFAGELCPEELRNWYAASDIAVLPSYKEGLPRVLLEAQAMERPAVAYDVGGVAEAIRNGNGGYLVRKGDVEELAMRLKNLLEDPAKQRVMGREGRRFVIEKFSLDSLAIRHENFYARIFDQMSLQPSNMTDIHAKSSQ